MSKINFIKLIGSDFILLNYSFPPLLKLRWTTIEEIYMRLIECGVSSHLTIETLTSIIRTKNKDDDLLKKSIIPTNPRKYVYRPPGNQDVEKDPIKQRIKNKVLFSRVYIFENNKETKTVVEKLNLNFKNLVQNGNHLTCFSGI